MKQIKWIVSSCFLIVLTIVLGACQTEEKQEKVTSNPFEVGTELFLYEDTMEADVIAVDEEGYLYTATCITNIEEETVADTTYKPFIQQFKVYDLEGNCVREAEVGVGNGNISFLTAEGDKLYCIVGKSFLSTWGPALYTIDTNTWEVTELYQFENYSWLTNFTHVGDYFYVIGQLKEVPEKDYELHPDVDFYNYYGECISRIKVGEENPQEEIISIDFPIDIVGTNDDTILIYHYNEEKGFGFLEFYPEEVILEEVGWTESNNKADSFTECGNGFLFWRDSKIFYGTTDNIEVRLTNKEVFASKAPTYQRGFLFYRGKEGIERMGVANLIKKNTPIRLLMCDDKMQYEPYDSGYQVKSTILDQENYALKVLAQDSDFDMYLLESRDDISYNIKEKGAFYALNEIEGVQEYLDACFPYIKEVAMREDGDIWMIPVGSAISILMYHKEYYEMEEVDLSKMNFAEFLTLVEEVETENSEQGSISTYVIIEELFKQYLSVYDSFDTDLFRSYAKQIRQLQENAGELFLSLSMVSSVRPETEIGRDGIYTQEQLDQIPYFFYEYELYNHKFFQYTDRLGSSDIIGIAGVPRITEEKGNISYLTFLAVNPKSKNLKSTLDYISDFCKYMLNQKDTFLLADESTYTDIPFIKECYEVYKDGAVFFDMDSDIYWNPFWEYVEGEMELEELIEEMERKRKIYVGE